MLAKREEESRLRAQEVGLRRKLKLGSSLPIDGKKDMWSYLDNSEAFKSKHQRIEGTSSFTEPSVNIEHIVRQARGKKT